MSPLSLLQLLALLRVGDALPGHYALERSYMGEDFFSRFWFWKWPDLTHGHVEFVDEHSANYFGMTRASADRVYIGADHWTKSDKDPRKSVKIFSDDVYNSGLFIISLDHMPTGCGTWPAFWMTGGNSKEHWPAWGEFDIIEGVHVNSKVSTALHTDKGCSQATMIEGRDFTGTWQKGEFPKPHADDCYVHAPGQYLNQGCGQTGPEGSMGPDFNAKGGGTYVAQWSPLDDGTGFFRTWFWANGTEPKDVVEGRPNPDYWGVPYSYYALDKESCPQSHFKNMRLVFDLTFCGDMAGATFAKKCPAEAAKMSCEDWVSSNPEAFKEAYWSIRRLETYQWKANPVPAPTTMAPFKVGGEGGAGGFEVTDVMNFRKRFSLTGGPLRLPAASGLAALAAGLGVLGLVVASLVVFGGRRATRASSRRPGSPALLAVAAPSLRGTSYAPVEEDASRAREFQAVP